MSMRGDSKTAHHVAARVSNLEDSSSATRSLPAAPVAAGARGITPHAHEDSEMNVICFDESDLTDLGKDTETTRAPESPAVSQPESASNGLPKERTRDLRHSLFN